MGAVGQPVAPGYLMRFLITTLAEYQTSFWLKVGIELTRLGHDAAFISFDDRSSEMLKASDLRVYSATRVAHSADSDEVLARFGVTRLNLWLSHERFAFGAVDSASQRRKLADALLATDAACRDWLAGGPAVMVQELGGFLSVVGSYFAARHNGIDNWFIEPSFFRGRLFFVRNDFAAPKVPDDHEGAVPEEVRRYLQKTISSGAIVIPRKDRHQYTTAWKKIVNFRNARRLAEKLSDKYLRGKRQEFGYIGSHVRTHARMLWNSHRLRGHYTPLREAGPFVYYPLHVPGDMALTLRTPQFLDQIALIDLLCRSVPANHRIAVKEHPAMVGAVDAMRLCELLGRYDNLVLLPPSTNNYEVLGKADAVVSINSKSGAEGLLLGKEVLVLGDAFYRSAPRVRLLGRLEDLPAVLEEMLKSRPSAVDHDSIERYFAAAWQRSFPGELYVAADENVSVFSKSMVHALGPA